MWERIDLHLPSDLSRITTSVWRYGDLITVGVMRSMFLAPPVLWAKVQQSSFAALRVSREKLDDLQAQLVAPSVFAEASCYSRRDQKFLEFLGFTECGINEGRKLYQRSL